MAFETYRVRRSFQWDGWMYAPKGECRCPCREDNTSGCTGYTASDCNCRGSSCHCDCGIKREQYAGDIWIVLEGHPRKEAMLNTRFATGDPSIPSADELLEKDEYKRLLDPYPGSQADVAKKRGRPVATSPAT